VISLIASLDTQVLQTLYAARTPELVLFFSWVTLLGNTFVITIVAISMIVILWRHKRFEYKAGLAVALFGSLLASYLIKIVVERARPDIALHAIAEAGYSFPSMHATVAMATYGFLIYMTYKLMHPPHHRPPWIIFLSALILLIGFSRLYLGVHYASDVIAGFAIGGLFLSLGIVVARKLKNPKGV